MSDLPSYDQLLAQARAAAAEVRAEQGERPNPPNLRLRNTAIIAGSTAAIGAYAFNSWWKDGFTRKFRTVREGGFSKNAELMGIDKLGHAYSTYVATRALTNAFCWVGNSPGDARRLAAFSAWGVMTAAEIGDGFSRRYRFSHEDFIANTAGALLGYALESHPEWDGLVDFRLHYRPSPLSGWDPPGDYAGQRFFLVLKADGVRRLRELPVMRYLELGVGYGTPGVDTPDEWNLHDFAQRRREIFVSVSLNFSRVIADVFYGGERGTTRMQRAADFFFEVVQLPAQFYRAHQLESITPIRSCGTLTCIPP